MSELQGNMELGPSSPNPNRELSFGEKAVGLAFNPGGDPAVYACKSAYAQIIDMLNDLRAKSKSEEQMRHFFIAIIEAEAAQMRAVNAITWKD